MKFIGHKYFVHMIIIIITGILAYSNTLYNPFMFDDAVNIVENPIIKDFEYFSDNVKVYKSTALGGIKDFFRTRYIGYLSFAINYKIHKLEVFGYHVFNIAIHIINALLVYWLAALSFRTPFLKNTIGELNVSGGGRNDFYVIALFVSLIFIAHPIQTQAVTYIVQRFTSMATMFYLLSFVFYIKSRLVESKYRRYGFYAVSLISAVLSMKTKEIAFTLPVMIMIDEFMFFEGEIKKRALYLIPIFLTMLIIPLTLITNNFVGSHNIDEAFKIASFKNDISPLDYLFTQFTVIVAYIRLMFPPVIQNLDYEYPIYRSFFIPDVFLSFLLLLLLFCLGIYLLRRSSKPNIPNNRMLRLSAFGIFWFFITLSVESSIIPIDDVIFEHRVYLPSVGFFMAIVVLLMTLKRYLHGRFLILERAVIPVLLVIILIFAGSSYARNTIWQDGVKFWEDVVKKSPNKPGPHNNLAKSYLEKNRIDEAVAELQIALRINPEMPEADFNLGLAYIKQRRFDEALEKFMLILKNNPYNTKAHLNIGMVYFELNYIDDAVRSFKNAIKIDPYYADAHYNLGLVYGKEGKMEDAFREFDIALELKPSLIIMHNNLGVKYFNEGKLNEAIRVYETVIRLKPDMIQAHYNMGLAYKKQGRLDAALKKFDVVLRLNPDDDVKKRIETLYDEIRRK